MAITLTCDEMKENALVYHNGKEMKWAIFKSDFNNWEFESNDLEK